MQNNSNYARQLPLFQNEFTNTKAAVYCKVLCNYTEYLSLHPCLLLHNRKLDSDVSDVSINLGLFTALFSSPTEITMYL